MAQESMGFFGRLWLGFLLPWRVLFDGSLAARIRQLLDGAAPQLEDRSEGAGVDARDGDAPAGPSRDAEPGEPTPLEPEPVPAPAAPGTDPTTALQLLGILQREGRFVDFLQEDVTAFPDADIGAAARVVHEGCRRGLADYLELAAIRSESEGDSVVLEEGFDPRRVRVTGNVSGEPPYRGHLAHHGWQVLKIELPTSTEGNDPRVVAPAEVEL